MKQFLLSLLLLPSVLLLTATPAAAQLSGNVEYNLWRVQPGDTLTIFSDKAYIRQSASLQAPIMDSLIVGSPVIATKLNETELTLRGMTAPWWQVRYKAGGKQKEGYLWLGLAALGTYRQDTVQFQYGIEKVIPGATKEEDPKYLVILKALSTTHHVLDKKEQVVAGGQFAISAEGKLLGNMGLDKVTTILRLCFSGEACGIPSDFFYFGWNGSKFLVLPQKSTIFDAGAIAHDEVLLFPKEPGGQPGKIIKVIKDEEFGEDGETIVKRTTDREVFVWDGENAVKETSVKEKVVTEKVVTEKQAKEKAATGKVATEKAVTEKAVTEKTTKEKATAGKVAPEKVVTEKKVNEKVVTRKVSPEKAVTDKPTKEKVKK